MNYKKIKDGPVIAVDVDDTIVMWHMPKNYSGITVKVQCNGFTEEAIPNMHVIEHIKKMKRRGHSVVVWSAGGSDWAEAVIEALSLGEYVDVICPKFDYHMDDNKDPIDKIGKWCYISPEGYAQKQKYSENSMTLTGWKIGEE